MTSKRKKTLKIIAIVLVGLILLGSCTAVGGFLVSKIVKLPTSASVSTSAPIVVTVVVTPVPPTSAPTNAPTSIPTATSTPRPTATPVTIPGLTAPLSWHGVEMLIVEAHLQEEYPLGNGRSYHPRNQDLDTLLVIETTTESNETAVEKLHDYYDEVYVVTNSGEEENCNLIQSMVNRTPRKVIFAFIIPKYDDFELYEIYFPGEEGVSLDSFF